MNNWKAPFMHFTSMALSLAIVMTEFIKIAAKPDWSIGLADSSLTYACETCDIMNTQMIK
eukprot:CAMPEP_0168340822 /NCGR_PEP_ID=MMETSP0213-20121227/14295_1 /TAXON_ID=151035 /ORGANISM="Euplotes harpa, Strain FSP1.4" /LENGTH=59 /DNA_ID=CAMNT_0008347137 /DNA_START=158 /DNA_END=337 /DNA_ORIENTATION=-